MQKCFNKLLLHLYNLRTADKYLQLLCAIGKFYYSWTKSTKLKGLEKELKLTRRVIRWMDKYQTFAFWLKKHKESMFMTWFRLWCLCGDIFDCVAFWLATFNGFDKIVARLQIIQSNFYFGESIANAWIQCTHSPHINIIVLLKIIRFLCNCITSSQNGSFKFYTISQEISGLLSLFAGIINMVVLWMQ